MKRRFGMLLVLMSLAGGTLFEFSGCNFLNDVFGDEEEVGTAESAGAALDDFFDSF